jgi:cytochrome c peroxidase
MRTTDRILIAVVCGAIVGSLACSSSKQATVEVDSAKLKMFSPVPAVVESPDNPITEEKVALGRMLYYETRLSKGQDHSCNSCHGLNTFGVDGKPVSEGHKGVNGTRNSPTVYNAAGHIAQFWDGRAPTVEEQAKGPVMNPVEMAMPSEKYVLGVLKSMPGYVEAFKKAFPEEKDPVTFDNMAKAIGVFERKLATPSRWDKFLEGDQSALTEAEKAGFNKFMDAGCQTCHNGAYLGGSMFQKVGIVEPYPDTKDLGRYDVTKQDADKFVFKVPSLRNIEKTAPYYHDGSVATLETGVKTMAEYQLGKQLTDEEVASIVTWLKSLTGEIPADYVQEPALPASTSKTPKPDMT